MQKFFCDNCGTEVDKNSGRCPHCGRYFKSVKCPKCGLTGMPDIFTNGCPSCGYAQEIYDIEIAGEISGRRGEKRRTLSDRFYRRVLPVLLVLFIALIILLIRTGL